jgi:hypothetical protein
MGRPMLSSATAMRSAAMPWAAVRSIAGQVVSTQTVPLEGDDAIIQTARDGVAINVERLKLADAPGSSEPLELSSCLDFSSLADHS